MARACSTSWTAFAGRACRSPTTSKPTARCEKVELPFVVGVLADLSGQPKEPLKPLKERKFVNIDRDNFNDVLAKAAPRLAMKVENKLTGERQQAGRRAELQAHRRLRAGPRRRAGRAAQGTAGHATAA